MKAPSSDYSSRKSICQSGEVLSLDVTFCDTGLVERGDFRYWPTASVSATQRYFWFWGLSGSGADTVQCVAIDPNATSARFSCCGSKADFSPYQSAHLRRYDAVS